MMDRRRKNSEKYQPKPKKYRQFLFGQFQEELFPLEFSN